MAKNDRPNEIPDEEDNPFLTLGELLRKKIPVTDLADAIEKHGIYTVDRYGRFGLANVGGKKMAMALLALQYEWEYGPDNDRHREEDPPLERIYDGENQFDGFGWSKEVYTSFMVPQNAANDIHSRVPVGTQQEDAIIGWLRNRGVDPLNMPVPPPGKAGVKAECRNALQGTQLIQSVRTFDEAWSRLRKMKKIKDGS